LRHSSLPNVKCQICSRTEDYRNKAAWDKHFAFSVDASRTLADHQRGMPTSVKAHKAISGNCLRAYRDDLYADGLDRGSINERWSG